MTPQEAVSILANIIAARDGFTEHAIYSEMHEQGVPHNLADRAYKLTQIAWSRSFLSQFGVQFPSEYYWLDSNGKVIESGQLSDEPCFAIAASLSRQYSKTPGFQRLARMSADVQAVADLVKRGSNPRKIEMTPAIMFSEAPTEQGLQAADRMTEELLTARRAAAAHRRPWWKFW